jgi:hypothetical protein
MATSAAAPEESMPTLRIEHTVANPQARIVDTVERVAV